MLFKFSISLNLKTLYVRNFFPLNKTRIDHSEREPKNIFLSGSGLLLPVRRKVQAKSGHNQGVGNESWREAQVNHKTSSQDHQQVFSRSASSKPAGSWWIMAVGGQFSGMWALKHSSSWLSTLAFQTFCESNKLAIQGIYTLPVCSNLCRLSTWCKKLKPNTLHLEENVYQDAQSRRKASFSGSLLCLTEQNLAHCAPLAYSKLCIMSVTNLVLRQKH